MKSNGDSVLKQIHEQFRGEGYYRPVAEGISMQLEEIVDHPLPRYFKVLFNKDRSKILQAVRCSTLGIEGSSTLDDQCVFDEIGGLLDKQSLTALWYA